MLFQNQFILYSCLALQFERKLRYAPYPQIILCCVAGCLPWIWKAHWKVSFLTLSLKDRALFAKCFEIWSPYCTFSCACLDVDLLSAVRVTLLESLERVRTGKCKFTRIESCSLPPSKASDSMDNWIVTTNRDNVSPDGRCRRMWQLRAVSPCPSDLCRPLPLPSCSLGLGTRTGSSWCADRERKPDLQAETICEQRGRGGISSGLGEI